LGCIKFRNSACSRRNFFIIQGHGLFTSEYHKARAATNFSYFVVRYLPDILSILTVLYIAYVRPFANMIYSQTLLYKHVDDGNYLFCSDESPQKCWNGKILSKTLQEESQARLGVKINMRTYRQAAIAIAKTHLKEIAAYFDRNDELCERLIAQNKDHLIFSWQAGHQWSVNASTYGLDKAFPCHLQPELLRQYLRISLIWHRWLKLLKEEEQKEDEVRAPKKKRKMVHCAVQTTSTMPLSMEGEEEQPESSQETKRLQGIIADAKRMIELRREEKKLRDRLKI